MQYVECLCIHYICIIYVYINIVFDRDGKVCFFVASRWLWWSVKQVGLWRSAGLAAAVWNGIHESWHGENKPLTGIYIYMYNDLWWNYKHAIWYAKSCKSCSCWKCEVCVCSQCSCAHISIWFWMYDASRALWPCLETQFDAQQTIPL